MDNTKIDPLRHYRELYSINEVVDKWIDMWLPPMINLELGRKELKEALALVGKLSTPRPTDWEKVLPKKWREAKHLGRGKCGEYYVKGANRMLRDCFNAVKGLVRR